MRTNSPTSQPHFNRTNNIKEVEIHYNDGRYIAQDSDWLQGQWPLG